MDVQRRRFSSADGESRDDNEGNRKNDDIINDERKNDDKIDDSKISDGKVGGSNPDDSSNGLKLAKPTSTQHSDLPTFLAYAQRTGLDPKSTVYVGTHYEYTVAAALSRYGFQLKRIGGVSDRGTDLLGTWTLPSDASTPTVSSNTSTAPDTTSSTPTSSTPASPNTPSSNIPSSTIPTSPITSYTTPSPWPLMLRVVVQCKYGDGSGRVGPRHVRELEGAFAGAPAGWRGNSASGVVGVLVGETAATRGVRAALARSRWPMAFALCSREGRVEQLLWNGRVEMEGLEGFSVGVRRFDDQAPTELVLLRNGQVVG